MNQLWHWQTWQDCSYLTCDLLESWEHGFFTQEFYPRTPEDLTSILQPQSTAYRVRQIHGNEVLTTREILSIISTENSSDSLARADGVISDRSGQSVWVASADCTPVLIGDLTTRQTCAVHAGWRGTAQKIVPQAISKFLNSGSQLNDLRIAVGPAISGEVYQVDESVAVDVGKSIISDNFNLTEREILQKLKQLAKTPILDDELSGKVRLDVSRVNQIQLEQLGLDSRQIAIAPYCTFRQSKTFFSYRRTGEKKVQWSGIVSNQI